ncbi:Uncharacterized protein YR821_1986 [Yersinia ruckeri]|uniref:Uncharacterized protein n=1 Tax=Yersinia ruckeri TaxID=29486 RepID=A0A0A8VDH9_YERRU|nr:hypothetical protein yruck0001_11840 [Yersinia ruckeri ATCC 29473]QTD76907.1 Uncharacterized protein YR821_1986 [Yersinia ruckeri]CEK27802.1 hypothetical protein CSF007_10260 [Yersinia ruckeri]
MLKQMGTHDQQMTAWFFCSKDVILVIHTISGKHIHNSI